MTDLASDLATLRIERGQPAPRPRRWHLALGASALLLGAAATGSRAWRTVAGSEVDAVRAVAVPSAADGPARAPVLTASGYLVARRKAVVSARIQGRLSELLVEEASQVRQGELIARLESDEYQAQVERSRAAVRRAEAELAEYRRLLRLAQGLARDGVLAVDQREAADSRARIAEAALQQAQAELALSLASLESTRIRAPFAGTVVRKMAGVGESVVPMPAGVSISTSSGAIVVLADLDTLEVEADVSETSVSRLGSDQPAEVSVEAFPGRKYRGVLRQLSPTADRTKATVQVRVTILEKHVDLRPEMSARVAFLERGEVKHPGGETLVARPPVTLRDGDAVKVRTLPAAGAAR